MQNIKNVITAIGTDIGNLNRHYDELHAAVEALRRNPAPAPAAPAVPTTQNAPAVQGGIISLDFQHNIPAQLITGESKFLSLPIPKKYQGCLGIFSEGGSLQPLGETLSVQTVLKPNTPISVFVFTPQQRENVEMGSAAAAEEATRQLAALKLSHYAQAEDFRPDLLGELPEGFTDRFGSQWGMASSYTDENALYELAHQAQTLKDGMQSEAMEIAGYTDEIRTAFEQGDDALMAFGARGISPKNLLGDNWMEISDFEEYEQLKDQALANVDKWIAFAEGARDKARDYQAILTQRREAQDGEKIRQLQALGGVLSD